MFTDWCEVKTAKLRPNAVLRDAIFNLRPKVTQATFAKQVGIDPGLISAYIQGKRRPTVAHRDVLARALRKPVNRLFAAFRPRRKVKSVAERIRIAAVRLAVFDREGGRCRCCVTRAAESLHELKPRSLGGDVSTANSIALCGSGTTGCHGYLTRHEIAVSDLLELESPISALRPLRFSPKTPAARDWLSGVVSQDAQEAPGSYPERASATNDRPVRV